MREWTLSGPRIDDPATIATVKRVLDEVGPIIVEHWHYYGGRAPTRSIFDDAEDFDAYLRDHTKPGDSIWLWSFAERCNDESALAHGKVPDAEGRTPVGGAY